MLQTCYYKLEKNKIGIASNFEVEWVAFQKEISVSDLMKMKNDFKNLVGINAFEDLFFTTPLNVSEDMVNVKLEYNELDNPNIKILTNEINKIKEEIKYIKREYVPYISFFIRGDEDNGSSILGSFDTNWEINFRDVYKIGESKYYDNMRSFVGLTGICNILDGNVKKNLIKRNEALLEAKKIEFQELVARLNLKIKQNVNTINNLKKSFDILSHNIDLSLKNIQFAEMKYKMGEYGLKEVLDAYLEYTDIQSKYLNTTYDINIAVEMFKLNTLTSDYEFYTAGVK
ncbi:MAG: TolC family protein [Endomicrobium sp.]|jgi:outer membrane protein TolC|nr:TolC family protein [Endomicrobium sp.]